MVPIARPQPKTSSQYGSGHSSTQALQASSARPLPFCTSSNYWDKNVQPVARSAAGNIRCDSLERPVREAQISGSGSLQRKTSAPVPWAVGDREPDTPRDTTPPPPPLNASEEGGEHDVALGVLLPAFLAIKELQWIVGSGEESVPPSTCVQCIVAQHRQWPGSFEAPMPIASRDPHLVQAAVLASSPDAHLCGSGQHKEEPGNALGADGEADLVGHGKRGDELTRMTTASGEIWAKQHRCTQAAAPAPHPAPDLGKVVGACDVVEKETPGDGVAGRARTPQAGQDFVAPEGVQRRDGGVGEASTLHARRSFQVLLSTQPALERCVATTRARRRAHPGDQPHTRSDASRGFETAPPPSSTKSPFPFSDPQSHRPLRPFPRTQSSRP